jgi:hypothetical protein
MSGHVIDYMAEKNARIEEAKAAGAKTLRDMVEMIAASLPNPEESRRIMAKAFAEPLPENLTEDAILRGER